MSDILSTPEGISVITRILCHEMKRRAGRFFHRNVVRVYDKFVDTGSTDLSLFVGPLNEFHDDELLSWYEMLEANDCAEQGPQGEQGIQGIQGEQGEPGPEFLYWQAECLAQPNNTVGYFTRSTASTSNPGGLATTHPSNLFQNGTLVPWIMPGEWRLYDLKVLVSAAAVSTATVGSAPTFRLDLYQVNTANRSLISTERLPCISGAASIQPNNTLTNAASFIYFAKDTFTPAIEPSDSTLFGIEFVNESGSEDTINAFSRALASIVFQRIT